MKSISLMLLVSVAAATDAFAETCKYEDPTGKVTYSNVPVKNAKKLQCFEPPPAPQPAPKQAKTAPPAASTNVPNVDSATQQKRDDERRKILESELVLEEKLLAESKQALSEGESVRLGNEKNYQKYIDRIQELKDNVGLHEKNVAALKQELAAFK